MGSGRGRPRVSRLGASRGEGKRWGGGLGCGEDCKDLGVGTGLEYWGAVRKTGGRQRSAVLGGSGADRGGTCLGYWETIQHMEKTEDEALV